MQGALVFCPGKSHCPPRHWTGLSLREGAGGNGSFGSEEEQVRRENKASSIAFKPLTDNLYFA
jgi:hypothetical protein